MLRRRRRPLSPEYLSPQFSTVRSRRTAPRRSTNSYPARRPLLGILFVLFSKCIAAFLNPLYRKRDGGRWVLVSYTVASFSFATVYTADPQRSGHFLHRQSRIHKSRWDCSWTARILVVYLSNGARHHPQPHAPLEYFVSGRSWSVLCFTLHSFA